MRKFVLGSALVMLGLGFSVATASAADKPKASPEDLFKRLDTNSDGKLTLEEFIGKRTGEAADKAKANFPKFDKNSDGALDLDEFKAAMSKKK
jgi:Ca2+-binding EF-hand superfamily protein